MTPPLLQSTDVNDNKQKIDYQFRLLYAIAITLVVAGHVVNGGVNILFDWFTPYAFHLGIFAFGSGYFYKEKYARDQIFYLKRKVARLIIPFYLCNLFYGIVVSVLKPLGLEIGDYINFNTLIVAPLQHGHQFIYNLGTWFVVPLFVVEIFNNATYRLFLCFKRYREIIIFVLYVALGALSISLARHGYNTGWYLLLTRSMFLLPMFGLGMLYRKYRFFDSVNTWLFIFIIMILQYFLIVYYRGPVGNDICWMKGFRGGVLLPFFLEFLGIFFWLRVCAVLTPIAKKSKIVLMIGEHTFEIMAHHLFAIMLIKIFVAGIAMMLPINFNFNEFAHDIWYYYVPRGVWQSCFFYAVAGVALPLLYVCLKNRARTLLSNFFYKQ